MALNIKRNTCKLSSIPLQEGMHPVLERVYRHRGITDAAQLQLSLGRLHEYRLLKNISDAVQILESALYQQKSIVIIGDFDADGATSTAVAVRALRQMGARHVNFLVPNRFEFGYGLTPEIVREARVFNPDLIVTVDNGISSIDGVAAAKQQGMQVIVTDHHLPGESLPEADAIVNPNQSGDSFPSKCIAGVGVIFYLMMALRAQLRKNGWFEQQKIAEPNLAELLDLVALGTVADVVPLDHCNRILVAQGIARIRAGACCSGIRALTEVAGREPRQVRAQDLGFLLGPRLNAAGRLDDMSLGIECLITDNDDKAKSIARQLSQLNDERRSIEQNMKMQALDVLSNLKLRNDNQLPHGLCLYEADWHQGVIGILASRIKDKHHRPVIAFADGGDDTNGELLLKGSARSISGVHIRDILDAIATRHPGMLTKFGGHAMAAGMTLPKSQFKNFSKAFDEEVRNRVSEDELCQVIHSDGELSMDEIDLTLARIIDEGGPWGQHFAEPVFDGRFDIVERRIVGERHLKLLLRVPGTDKLVDAIAFHAVDDAWPEHIAQVDIAYKLNVNEFRGVLSTQLVVNHIEPVFQVQTSVQNR